MKLNPTDAGKVAVMSNGQLVMIEMCFTEGKKHVFKIGGLRYGANGKQLGGCPAVVVRVLDVGKMLVALEAVDRWFKGRTEGFQKRCSRKLFKSVSEALE